MTRPSSVAELSNDSYNFPSVQKQSEALERRGEFKTLDNGVLWVSEVRIGDQWAWGFLSASAGRGG